MATTPQQDLTAINNYAGQYEQRIRTSIFNGLDIATDLNLITNLTAPRIMPKYKANEGLRPYDVDVVDPDGQAGTFSQRTIVPRTAMKILRVVPEELRKTYLSEMLKANAPDYPQGFAQYFWDEQIKKQRAEINNNSYFGVDGQLIPVYDGGTVYAVDARVRYANSYFKCLAITTAGQSPESHPAKWQKVNNSSINKGLGTIIADEYAALPARNKIATGTIDATNAFDKVTNFYLAIPEEIRNLGGIIRCSRSTYDNYNMSALAKFTNGTSFLDIAGANGKVIGKSIFGSDGKWILQPASWMSGSKRLVADVDKNLYFGTDLTSDFTSIGQMIPFVHGYTCKMQLVLAFQIADLDILFVNDQA
ncbi:hypothetical protein [Spirosoma sordidisoli]|uniref:Phage major capsid protein n=1 Tax=Spirosoma sordidisoli TaxID=2502893 RepID=A0A4V1RWC5_9BACT|nr:hypothetical protein [Spirosoma sordidisoli]RYC69788.1 hypothetical protein EQG79_14430 [Spirosoma sordidisoli]